MAQAPIEPDHLRISLAKTNKRRQAELPILGELRDMSFSEASKQPMAVQIDNLINILCIKPKHLLAHVFGC